MTADEDILRAFVSLFRAVGGDPLTMPIHHADDLYRAFESVQAPPDVLALVASWHRLLTNRELLPLILIRARAMQRSTHG